MLRVTIEPPLLPKRPKPIDHEIVAKTTAEIAKFDAWQDDPAFTIKSVGWKHEGSYGPIFINRELLPGEEEVTSVRWGEPFPTMAEVGWYKESTARRIAKTLGVPYYEA